MDEFERAYAAAVASGAGATAEEAAVDAAASVLAAAGERWEGAAGKLAGRVVRECGARGWELRDLVRMAGRELDARHERLARAAGDGEEPFLAEFARSERLDRFSTATALVELLCLYGRLPRITPLTPGPASAPPATGPHSKMLARIRALLAKAESTGFPEEAEALSAKAQHLMARHSIDEALVAATGAPGAPGRGPGACRIGVDRPYEGAKALLLDAVAAANRCQAVWAADFGFSTVVGFATDLEAVELLYTSLLVQADHALRGGTSRSRDFRESFLIGYAGRVRERLAAATREAQAETATPPADLLPVLAAREVDVRDATRRMFPSTTTSRLKGRDAEGWRHGEAAADRARF
ncbi:DUF2786 domain-containing protein [Streptomyces sp. NPDC088197]|uniref:DUF2786 domain-containing protein n=1 Tax=Streptomyces sp. NPDC088197 TaxID=3365840 RepID=UPI00381B95C5